jgi:hypothetical protein
MSHNFMHGSRNIFNIGSKKLINIQNILSDVKSVDPMQANPDYKGVCHVALAQEGHCRPGEVFITSSALVEDGKV